MIALRIAASVVIVAYAIPVIIPAALHTVPAAQLLIDKAVSVVEAASKR